MAEFRYKVGQHPESYIQSLTMALTSPIPFETWYSFCFAILAGAGGALLDGVGSFHLQLDLSYDNASYS